MAARETLPASEEFGSPDRDTNILHSSQLPIRLAETQQAQQASEIDNLGFQPETIQLDKETVEIEFGTVERYNQEPEPKIHSDEPEIEASSNQDNELISAGSGVM